MKKILFPAFILLISALVIAVIPTDAEGAIYDDTVRLHIIANSDSEADQALKLDLRDAVLENFGAQLATAENANDAEMITEALLPEIELFSEEFVSSRGYSYSVSASLTKEYYGTRVYEDFTLPSGEYISLRIIIGEGEGQNWWCVMYPPMCLDASLCGDGAAAYSNEEVRLIKSGGFKIKFKILELLSEKFR